jgi:tetratricopeptide (TPR) repeat protein
MEREQEISAEFLLISRYGDPPAEATVIQALSGTLGYPTYTAAPPPDPNSPPTGRVKVGVYTLTAPSGVARARIIVERYSIPALDGMGETAFNQLTRRLGPNDVRTLKAGLLSLDTLVTCAFAAAVEAQRWALDLLRTLIALTEGAALDPLAQTAWNADLVTAAIAGGPRAHITIDNEAWSADSRWLHTHGLAKFGRSELDFVDIPVALESEAQSLLLDIADNLAQGPQLSAGQEIALDELGALVAFPATPDLDHQAPWGRLRLYDAPTPPQRQTRSARLTIARVALADAERLRSNGETSSALEVIERALAANSDDIQALALKARILLDNGHSHDALELGELMELRTPGEYHGPLIIGMALLALGRYREALNALDRAIEREPEAAQAYSARGEAYARLGDQRLASVDRARAAYLRG